MKMGRHHSLPKIIYSLYFDFIYVSISSATFFVAATASTTVLAPDTTSPAAYTPGRVVAPFEVA